MRKILLGTLVLALCPLVFAQQSFSNDTIIKMAKAGISDDLIVTTINAQAGTYDTSADGIIALKTAGVSDKVVAAMVTKATIPAQAVPTPTPAASATSDDKPANASAPASQPAHTPASLGAPETQPAPAPNSASPGHKEFLGQIKPGDRVVIAPMGGFETYFAAAIREKRVPLTLTLNRDSAQYFIVSTETEWQGFVAGSGSAANWNRAGGTYGSASSASSTRGLESSIMLIDAKSKDVVWAYEVHKSSHGGLLFGTLAARGQQSLAEACAKHLKEYMETGK